MLLQGEGAGVSTILKGLLPDTTYPVGAHIRTGKGAHYVSLSGANFGATASSDQGEPVWVTFTTGEQNTSARIALPIGAGDGSVWADDLHITQKGN